MPDATTNFADPEDIIVRINSDTIGGAENFLVVSGSAGLGRFNVDEGGTWTIAAAIRRNAPVRFESTGSLGLVAFTDPSGAVTAQIDQRGTGIFNNGVRLRTVSTPPTFSGTNGDKVLCITSGPATYSVYLCTGGTTWVGLALI